MITLPRGNNINPQSSEVQEYNRKIPSLELYVRLQAYHRAAILNSSGADRYIENPPAIKKST